MTSNSFIENEKPETETFEVNITLTKPFYQITRLICELQYDLDWNQYVSELVKQDALNMKNGDCGVFREYVIRKLKNQD